VRGTASLGAFLGSALAAHGAYAEIPASDPFLTSGVRQVNEGDYETAVFTLDMAVRRLGRRPGGTKELAQAYVWLGAAYVGLEHETVAKAKFKQALDLDPQIRLLPEEFPPKVIKVFEAARLRDAAARRKRQATVALVAGGVVGGAALGISAATGGHLPANRPPIPAIGISPPGEALPGITTLTFTATASDPDGDPLTFNWDLGDGATAAGSTASHLFRSEGTFRVVLTASDGRGGTATTSASVTVRGLSGVWRPGNPFWPQQYQCVQSGALIECRAMGTFNEFYIRSFRGTLSHPRMILAELVIHNRGDQFEPDTSRGPCTGQVASDLNAIVCFHDNPTTGYAFLFTRP
jgi:hypothetical protein